MVLHFPLLNCRVWISLVTIWDRFQACFAVLFCNLKKEDLKGREYSYCVIRGNLSSENTLLFICVPFKVTVWWVVGSSELFIGSPLRMIQCCNHICWLSVCRREIISEVTQDPHESLISIRKKILECLP